MFRFLYLVFFLLPLLLFCIFLASGCAQFTNRVACTLDKQEALVVSKYYRLGISAEINPTDAAVICKVQP